MLWRKMRILYVVLLLSAVPVAAQKRGPSTPEERAKAVQLTRQLETDPLGKSAKDARNWLTLWLIEIPDMTVEFCTTFLAPLYESKKDFLTEVRIQPMYSQAAFMIENPEKAKDRLTVFTAGLEGALKAYEAILKEKPKSRSAILDDLIAKRDRGELREYVQQTMPRCK